MSHLLLADLRPFFNDYIRLDADFAAASHGQEYRIGLVQRQLRANGQGYPSAEGEYVGERRWKGRSARALRRGVIEARRW
jgi:hypothetical protein